MHCGEVIPETVNMSSFQIKYSEFPPIEGLRPWVQCLWSFDARELKEAPYDHFVPPDGCVSLLRNLNPNRMPTPLILVGPRWEPTRVSVLHGDYYTGFRFWPFAANTLLDNRLNELVGKFGPLSELVPDLASKLDVAGSRAETEWFGLTQKVLLIELENGCSIDELARVATEKIVETSGRIKLQSLANELDVSLRQLQRRFRQATGIGLKQFARLRRFHEAASELIEMTPRPWCHVAIDSGYSDQAHLTREFVQLIGLSPKQMQAKYDAIFHDLEDP